ncbi:hypothetical protein [Zunongwangia profunda]|uniref:hypothetical protein n=1 Tax=Zunongwangia profunda TaxID=398743 RepID=UPI00248F4082|nr:hypothetical protein [Zunongwangia profunda]
MSKVFMARFVPFFDKELPTQFTNLHESQFNTTKECTVSTPFSGLAQEVEYLSLYTHKIAISNWTCRMNSFLSRFFIYNFSTKLVIVCEKPTS